MLIGITAPLQGTNRGGGLKRGGPRVFLRMKGAAESGSGGGPDSAYPSVLRVQTRGRGTDNSDHSGRASWGNGKMRATVVARTLGRSLANSSLLPPPLNIPRPPAMPPSVPPFSPRVASHPCPSHLPISLLPSPWSIGSLPKSLCSSPVRPSLLPAPLARPGPHRPCLLLSRLCQVHARTCRPVLVSLFVPHSSLLRRVLTSPRSWEWVTSLDFEWAFLTGKKRFHYPAVSPPFTFFLLVYSHII